MARKRSRTLRLSGEDRQLLTRLIRTGVHPTLEVRRARILLELDEHHPDRDGPVFANAVIAQRVGVCAATIVNVAKIYTERDGDLAASIQRKKRLTPPVAPIVTGEVEARIIALACSKPPKGFKRWNLRLLERHVILTEGIPPLDHSTIGRVLKTPSSSESMLDHPLEYSRGSDGRCAGGVSATV